MSSAVSFLPLLKYVHYVLLHKIIQIILSKISLSLPLMETLTLCVCVSMTHGILCLLVAAFEDRGRSAPHSAP